MPVNLAFPEFFKLFERNTFQEEFAPESYMWLPHEVLTRYVAILKTHEQVQYHERVVREHCRSEIVNNYIQLAACS